MLKSGFILQNGERKRRKKRSRGIRSKQYKKLLSMGQASKSIINELDSPIDSVNRFINLALQTIEEDSHSRQFLLESKQGIRRTAKLLRRLNNYAKKMERELQEI